MHSFSLMLFQKRNLIVHKYLFHIVVSHIIFAIPSKFILLIYPAYLCRHGKRNMQKEIEIFIINQVQI